MAQTKERIIGETLWKHSCPQCFPIWGRTKHLLRENVFVSDTQKMFRIVFTNILFTQMQQMFPRLCAEETMLSRFQDRTGWIFLIEHAQTSGFDPERICLHWDVFLVCKARKHCLPLACVPKKKLLERMCSQHCYYFVVILRHSSKVLGLSLLVSGLRSDH